MSSSKILNDQFSYFLIASELFPNFLDQRLYLRLKVSALSSRSWAKISRRKGSCPNFLHCGGMTNNEGIPKSRDDSANLLNDFFLEDDYNSVSDIAAERSLTPSSSHLNCGAAAPAIKAYRLQIKDRWDSLELIIIHPNDQKKKQKNPGLQVEKLGF